MPNLNEFFDKKEKVFKAEMEFLAGQRPCSKCDENVEGAYWDASELTMHWKCSAEHENIYRVN